MTQMNRTFTLTLVAGFLALPAPLVHAQSKISSVDFKVKGNTSEIEIRSDGKIEFEKQENSQDKQIVIDLKNAELLKSASRKLDTSSFSSRVALISPYQVDAPDNGKNARLVIQLRDMAQANITQEGNTIRISVPNTGDAPPATDPAPSAPAEASIPAAGSNTPSPIAASAPAASTQNAESPKSNLDQFMATKNTTKFAGKPITLQVRDADLIDVFRLIGETSGFNIVVGDDVKGKITLALVDVPWDQALDLILHTQKLGAERNNNILRISSLTNLTKEKQLEFQAKVAAEANAPRVTRIFPISYADLTDLQATLQKFVGTSDPSLGSSSTANIVQADKRTNSIIVRDLPENIDKMKKLIELLDTQTPQVLIEAKIVEAGQGFVKAINGNLGGALFGSQNQFATNFNSGSIAGIPPFPGGATPASANFGISQSLGFLPGNARLNALLSLTETENESKTLASPKTVVLNKETATITQSQPVLLPVTTTANGVSSTGYQVLQANLNLTVTPTITNDGSVLMTLNMSRDNIQSQGSQPAVGQRNMTTKVLVESGTTLVIGGIYTNSTTKDSSGVPFLRKIPLIGSLFGGETTTDTKNELFFFITPRILNEKEAGLTAAVAP